MSHAGSFTKLLNPLYIFYPFSSHTPPNDNGVKIFAIFFSCIYTIQFWKWEKRGERKGEREGGKTSINVNILEKKEKRDQCDSKHSLSPMRRLSFSRFSKKKMFLCHSPKVYRIAVKISHSSCDLTFGYVSNRDGEC